MLFDAYGTLFDVYSVGLLAEQLFPGQGERLALLCRDKQIDYTRLLTLSGRYQPFWAVTRAGLRYAAERLGLALDGTTEERLMNQYRHLSAFPIGMKGHLRMVLAFFSGGGNSTLDDKVQYLKDWFGNTNISPYGVHGFWFYVTFPFICHNPENLDCSMGFGLPEGIVWTVTYAFIVLLILSFLDFGLPTMFMSVLMLIGAQIFLGVTVGYSLKCALSAPPRLPECLASETLRLDNRCLMALAWASCRGLWQTPCTDACQQLRGDCRELGFVDGFDTAVALVEFYLPVSASVWLRTSSTVSKIRSGLSLMTMFNGYAIVESFDA